MIMTKIKINSNLEDSVIARNVVTKQSTLFSHGDRHAMNQNRFMTRDDNRPSCFRVFVFSFLFALLFANVACAPGTSGSGLGMILTGGEEISVDGTDMVPSVGNNATEDATDGADEGAIEGEDSPYASLPVPYCIAYSPDSEDYIPVTGSVSEFASGDMVAVSAGGGSVSGIG